MKDLWRRLSPWLALGSLIIGTRLWYFTAQDLSDMPGASGPKLLVTATQGRFHNDWATWLVGCLLPTAGGDALLASQLASMIGGLAAALGMIFAGAALAGRTGAIGAGLAVGCWSMSTWMPLLTGPDPLVFGAAWLAIGLTWAGFALEFKGAPLVIAGSWLAMFSVAIRETAIPTLAFVALAPLMVRSWRGVVSLLAMGLGLKLGWHHLPQELNHSAPLNQANLSIETLKAGWEWVLFLQDRHMPEGRFEQLTVLALIAAALPGPKWARRALIGVLAVVIFFYTAAILGPKTRPRHLTSVAFGMVLMTGVLGGTLADLFKRWRGMRWAPAIVLALLMSLDTLAFMNNWGTYRAKITGAELPLLPAAPEIFQRRYPHNSDLNHRDLTAYGAAELVELASKYPGGIAIPRLRDERQYHLIAAAELQGLPWLVLNPKLCCREPANFCSRRLVEEINDANMTIVLPTEIEGIRRINASDEAWTNALLEAIEETEKMEEAAFWFVVPPDGHKTRPVPCPSSNPNMRGEGASMTPHHPPATRPPRRH